jgi:hypothetical protein
MVAVIALINLMLAAYPVMPDHGGKTLSALLSAAALAPNGKPMHKLAIFAGAIALVICGRKFTDGILSHIQDEKNQFQDRLKVIASKMVALAAEINN